jgi:hypothetical protein
MHISQVCENAKGGESLTFPSGNWDPWCDRCKH